MKIFLAGSTGAVGSRLLPLLVDRGHEVAAMTRSPRNEARLRDAGAEPVVADALDRAAVIQAVMRTEPDVIVHELTSLAGVTSLRRFDRAFALTDRLRTEGTDHLLEAARRTDVHRFIAQSFAGWNYERTGSLVKSESDPIDPSPPRSMRRSLDAFRYLESAVLGFEDGVVLRYASFYGAGTGMSSDAFVDLVRKRRVPVIGDGAGMFSFVHIDDAAIATVLAIERGDPGVYNVADDEPAPAAVWLPYLARELGAKPPRRVPAWLGRLLAGEAFTLMFTEARGVSNAKARGELGWRLLYPSWRDGFAHGLAERPVDLAAAREALGAPPSARLRRAG